MAYSKKYQETVTCVPSVIEFQEAASDDFISDPDQFRDQLPQPYRCIDKMLTNLIDSAWEIIFSRECERLFEASKVQVPKYQCSIKLDVRIILLY